MKSDINSVVSRVAGGDEQAFSKLCAEYEPLIRSMAVKYAKMADVTDSEQTAEDFSQEATLALYRAAQTYKTHNGSVSFGLYAKVCIRNALVSELRRMNRKMKADRAQERELKLKSQGKSRIARNSSDMPNLQLLMNGDLFSAFEKKVFGMYAGGMKIRDIASVLGASSKSVSNAVYRIKSKLRLFYAEDGQDQT